MSISGQQDFRNRARTKIIATVGPACEQKDQLADLLVAGADVFRLNMAHATLEHHAQTIAKIRQLSQEVGQPIGILVDLAGPKIRLGDLPGGAIDCKLDDRFELIRGAQPQAVCELVSSYEPLVDELSIGDKVMLADGTVSMIVEEKQRDRVRCRVLQPGLIRSRQGINLPGVTLSIPTLGDEDIRHAIWAAEQQADFVGLSFVRSPDDIAQLREVLKKHQSQAMVVAKIEKIEALAKLEQIVAISDAVMVARGDLGVEIDVAEMPMQQKRIIATCRKYQKPVIIATQMLDSMHHSIRPTRAEATDVANAILDGGDACMLSGETAIGDHPRAAVEIMNRIALATEAALEDRPPLPTAEHAVPGVHQITQSVVYGAGTIAHTLDAKLVVVASHSGATAQALSSQRNFIPTVGVSCEETTLRKMCLFWGVMPLRGLPARNVELLMQNAAEWGSAVGYLKPGDRMVVVGGSHLTAGVHDIIAVHVVGATPVP